MRPTRRTGRVWGPFRRAVMSWEGLEEVGSQVSRAGRGCEALPENREGSRGPGKVGSFSQRAERGQETLQKGEGGVWRPCQRAGMGQKSLLEILEGSGGLEEVGSTFWRAGRVREALLESR